MKTDKIDQTFDGEKRRKFMRALLDDLRALENMLEAGLIEEDVRRIGVEQEMFLVDNGWRPAPAALDMLDKLKDPHFTTELGMFNLEMNLDPTSLDGESLSRLEAQLNQRLQQARSAADDLGIHIVLTGILPSIRKSDLGLDNMVPKPRYMTLNKVMMDLRGGAAYQIQIKGTDEVFLKHDSVMVEACNTSFQFHLQVGKDEFANLYNIAQAISGPTLACATNSPLLFGRRLWAETRIALFQQAVDTRSASSSLRQVSPRVTFGDRWVQRSVLEIYREDVANFRALVGIETDEDPLGRLERGEIPELLALRHHNGTIYRWNRACYGLTDGKPHLRIENRVLPAGPTVIDEIANGAFWLGLMYAFAERYEDITKLMEFEHAALNFTTAARQGLGASFTWLDGEEIGAQSLILDRLLPLAADGLDKAGISLRDRDRLLAVIEERTRSGNTGSRWLLKSLQGMKDTGTQGERLHALAAATCARQTEGNPVAQWELARLDEGGGWKHNYLKVEQFMTTELTTVHEDDPVDLVANLMDWERIRHVPVEDNNHRFVGLVSYREVLRLFTRGEMGRGHQSVAVADIMRREVYTVSPDTPTGEAIALMRKHQMGCLPVVSDGRLVGVVTERDYMGIAGQLLEQKLRE